METEELDRAIMAAHSLGRTHDLARLYAFAASRSEAAGDVDAACFLLTHAYVFALESGKDAAPIHARLKAYGREE